MTRAVLLLLPLAMAAARADREDRRGARHPARDRRRRGGAGRPGPAPDDEEQKDKEKADTKEPLVVSGGVKGAEEIEGKPAILDVPTGRGRVVAFDFDPIHRYQTLGTF
jgi:hypothetical protein